MRRTLSRPRPRPRRPVCPFALGLAAALSVPAGAAEFPSGGPVVLRSSHRALPVGPSAATGPRVFQMDDTGTNLVPVSPGPAAGTTANPGNPNPVPPVPATTNPIPANSGPANPAPVSPASSGPAPVNTAPAGNTSPATGPAFGGAYAGPVVNAGTVNAGTVNAGTVSGEAAPVVAPAGPPMPQAGVVLNSGQEAAGGSFSLDSPSGVIYDMERGLALARGQVVFHYREFTVKGDKGLIDYNSNRATLAGNLEVTAGTQIFHGNTLVFDLDSGAWSLSDVHTTFPPDFFPQGTVIEPLYVMDGAVQGFSDQVKGENFRFSSCDRGHYYLISRHLDFYRTANGDPDRIVLHHNSLYILGHKILPLPVYVISLQSGVARRQPLQVTFGEDTFDGYFVKTLYDLRATPKYTDSLLLDAFQNRGIGVGYQREYAAGAGLLYLYALSGTTGGREVEAKVQRTFSLKANDKLAVNFDSTENNSVNGPGVSSETGNVELSHTTPSDQTSINLSGNSSSFGFGNSTNTSLQLQDEQNLGTGLHFSMASDLNQTDSEFSGVDTTADNTLTLTQNTTPFDAYLKAELHNDLSLGHVSELERLPEFSLSSNTNRISVPFVKNLVPGDFDFTLGQYDEPATGNDLQRADFLYHANNRKVTLFGDDKVGSVLTLNGSFEQAFYSDDAARYNYSYDGNLMNKDGPYSLQLDYSHLKTFGYTPFQFDYTVPTEYLDGTLSYQASKKFRFNLSGGRDIENDFTPDVISSAQWQPSKGFYTSLGTSFSSQTHDLGDIYSNFKISRPRQQLLGGDYDFGFIYDPTGAGLTQLNSSVDFQLGHRTQIQAFEGYDGYTKSFDFDQVRITRDLHCFNFYTTYDGVLRQLRFDIALKAFPFVDSRFGRDQFSTGFDPSVGGTQ